MILVIIQKDKFLTWVQTCLLTGCCHAFCCVLYQYCSSTVLSLYNWICSR